MRLSIRLAKETLEGIEELKKIISIKPMYKGLRITNGFVVDKAFNETSNFNKNDWEQVIKSNRTPNETLKKDKLEIKTNLLLDEQTVKGINYLKELFPTLDVLSVSYVTNSYVIRQIVKGALLKHDKQD
ncbi:hypothetical protein HED34_03730 [Vagococcus fluvialis]|uniref:hypothetical protein n=1 Tax=Vagococcus fluvialis TaxID=2738 RepID=UPI00143337F8|nr:hypothetical protein [Vagococcus fluvialis]NKC59071.1 hypothetical protein [Vagococcus fluvialis]NKD49826.1 hypothetical protein [Vagococcus fluvialis]